MKEKEKEKTDIELHSIMLDFGQNRFYPRGK